jgi:superfamily II DNA helicase RecQ
MVRYATEGACRKRTIHEHFGFDDLDEDCGTCDVCTDGARWQDNHLPPTRPLRVGPVATTNAAADTNVDRAPVQRGDWIEVQGLGPCCVQRVHRRGKGFHADVERAADLATHTIDLQRRRWRLVPK